MLRCRLVSRLHYKPFGGIQPARTGKEPNVAEPNHEQAGEPEWAAFAAIDWADQKHYWKLAPAGSGEQQQGEIENTPEAVELWAMELYRRFGGRPIAVCLEQARGALVCLLAKYSHLVLYPVHPKTAAQYRETFCPSGAKSDAGDTASLLDLLLRHRQQLRPLRPDSELTRLLQILVETRRQMVNEKTRQKNRLTACLKMYFPQILQWFEEVDSALVGALLEQWGTLPELQRAHAETLRKFFHQHNSRDEERIRQRIEAIQGATPATRDGAIVEGESRKARVLAAVIGTLRSHIEEYDRRIAEVVAAHPDGSLFASLPGAGPVLVPRLIVAFGTQRERFESAAEVQRFSGIAPVTVRSGNSKCVHMRRACPKFLRQTFHEFAAHSVGRSEWATVFYTNQRADHKGHHAAIRGLSYHWIRILFRCWKDRRPYDEQLYMRSLARRDSPLMGAFEPTTSGEWKLVAGFHKFCAKKT
jgi:transposase